MPKPLCKYCGKQVPDYRCLKHSVKWDSTGEYAHSKCYIANGLAQEIERAFQPMHDAIDALIRSEVK